MCLKLIFIFTDLFVLSSANLKEISKPNLSRHQWRHQSRGSESRLMGVKTNDHRNVVGTTWLDLLARIVRDKPVWDWNKPDEPGGEACIG